MNTTTNCRNSKEHERWLSNAGGFIWDIVVQLAAMREARGLSQAELAEIVGTKQQSISRLENPAYDRHSLQMLRRVAEALNAYIDITVIPDEKLEKYLNSRYQPILMDEPARNESENSIESAIWVSSPHVIQITSVSPSIELRPNGKPIEGNRQEYRDAAKVESADVAA